VTIWSALFMSPHYASRSVEIGGRTKAELLADLRKQSVELNQSAERLFTTS
jgi:hypothetical protein